MSMDTARYAELFRSESREHIHRINHLLLSLEAEGELRDLEEVFRAVHTLKGMSAAMELHAAAEVAHALEHLLERLRGRQLALDEEVAQALFAGVDALEEAIEGDAEAPSAERDRALGRLRELSAGLAAAQAGGKARPLRVSMRVDPAAPMPGVRAVLLLRRARELGTVGSVEPAAERLRAGDFQGVLSLVLTTALPTEAVGDALRSVGDLESLEVEEGGAEPQDVRGRAPGVAEAGWVRIRQDRLDALVDEVGELMVVGDRIQRLAGSRDDRELGESAGQLARLIGELRDDVMRLRMVPVREVFDRFPRLVRDTARSLGRRVSLTTAGAEVELDRSLLNELGDLLVHLIRNAIDHGIEPPEHRLAAGKPVAGEIRLRAGREYGRVVVRVEDDGRGVDRTRVLAVAAARGWLEQPRREPLSDEELLHWLTRPGFSTSESVTDVSGRGVGLNAVASRVESLGGVLELESREGEGTAFTLRLPVSLSLVRSLLVSVGREVYALPTASILELTEVEDWQVEGSAHGEEIRLHDGRIPLVRLSEVLGSEGPAVVGGPRPVVVVQGGQGTYGMLVDAVGEQYEAVLKNFDAPRGSVRAFAGAVLLPDGQPALILDAHRLYGWLGRSRAA